MVGEKGDLEKRVEELKGREKELKEKRTTRRNFLITGGIVGAILAVLGHGFYSMSTKHYRTIADAKEGLSAVILYYPPKITTYGKVKLLEPEKPYANETIRLLLTDGKDDLRFDFCRDNIARAEGIGYANIILEFLRETKIGDEVEVTVYNHTYFEDDNICWGVVDYFNPRYYEEVKKRAKAQREAYNKRVAESKS